MSEDLSSERVSKDLSERMSKDMSERCQKECQKICQKECQKICQAECVPSICAYIDLENKNSCLHQRNLVDGILFFVFFGTLQQVLLAQLCFCARK